MQALKYISLILLAGLVYCSTGQPTGPDSMPSTTGPQEATREWLYGSWTMDKEKTVRRMLQLNGQNFDSYNSDEKRTIMEQFNLGLDVELSPDRWNAVFREGTRTNAGQGSAEYRKQGDQLIISMSEVLDDGTIKVDELEIHRLGENLLRMRFIEEEEDVSFILRRN
ncbi:MAG: hypothetical protein RH862_12205 [Leptospiraceae bacterium]